MPRKRVRRLVEAIDLAETASGIADIIHLPPDGGDGLLSDVEEGDEEALPHQTSGLQAEVAGEMEVAFDLEEDDDEETLPSSCTLAWQKAAAHMQPVPPGTPFYNKIELLEDLVGKQPVKIFRHFFDEEMKSFIVEQSFHFCGEKQ